MRQHLRAVMAAVSFGLTALAAPVVAQDLGALVVMDLDRMVINRDSVSQASNAKGYLIGQGLSLDLLERQFPDLAPQFRAFALGVEARFGFPGERAERFLRGALGDAYDGQMEQLQTVLASQVTGPFSREDAEFFLGEMERRASGEVASPVKEAFLWLRYADHPLDEVIDGWTTRFISTGHPKSLSLTFQMTLPLSWKAEEGERPHIVQKWTNQNGAGLASILVLVRPLDPGPPVNLADLDALVASGGAQDISPEGFQVQAALAVTVDRQPALRLDMVGERRILDQRLTMHMRGYWVFLPHHLLMLQCQAGDATDRAAEAERSMTLHLPLCDWVARSLVFPDQY